MINSAGLDARSFLLDITKYFKNGHNLVSFTLALHTEYVGCSYRTVHLALRSLKVGMGDRRLVPLVRIL